MTELMNKYINLTTKTVPQKDWEIALRLKDEIGIEELIEEMEELFKSVKNGVNRTSEIVLGLRNFS